MERPDFDSLFVLEHLPLPLLVTRQEDGVILYLNERAAELLQIPKETAFSLRGFDFLADPDERAEMVGLIDTNGRVEELTVKVRTMSGADYRANLSAATIELNGTPCYIVIIAEVEKPRT